MYVFELAIVITYFLSFSIFLSCVLESHMSLIVQLFVCNNLMLLKRLLALNIVILLAGYSSSINFFWLVSSFGLSTQLNFLVFDHCNWCPSLLIERMSIEHNFTTMRKCRGVVMRSITKLFGQLKDLERSPVESTKA